MRSWIVQMWLIMSVTQTVSGCGLVVPNIAEPWDADKPASAAPSTSTKVPSTAQIEWEIKKKVYCELKDAVQYVNKHLHLDAGPTPAKLRPVKGPIIPLKWSAQVSLSLQVDETSGLNPGVTFNQIFPNAVDVFGPGTPGSVITAQTFNLGLGGTLSSTATRIDKFDPYWSIAYLMIPKTPYSVCNPGNDPMIGHGWTAASSSPFILESDLGIEDWLLGAMEVGTALRSEGAAPAAGGGGGGGTSNPAKDAISYEVKFVIVTNGSITPTWKLVRVSANTASSPFFNVGRTRTHDLIITIGPQNTQTNNSNLALQIGNAVANANRSLFENSQSQ